MLDESAAKFLDGPIPGQSLTTEPKSRPWEQPPKYDTTEEALDFYVPRLSNPELAAPMVDAMEEGMTAVVVADLIQSSGVMGGLHTIDVGLMVAPVLVELLVTQADIAGIKYEVGTEKADVSDPTMVRKAVDKASEEHFDTSIEDEEVVMEEEAPMIPSDGLMSRREV
jgi:hypothetical protein